MSDIRHFTAWLVKDTSALETGACDVTVLEDEALSYKVAGDGKETPIWTSTAKVVFHAVTTVDAGDGDTEDAMNEAKEALANAGWRLLGTWDAVDNGYIVTVERD